MDKRILEKGKHLYSARNSWMIAVLLLALGAFACALPAGLVSTTAPPAEVVSTVASLSSLEPVATYIRTNY